MEDVEVAVAVGTGIVLAAIVSMLVRRRGSREAQSVAGYRQALDVLGQVAGAERGARRHGSSGSGLPKGEPDEPGEAAPSRLDVDTATGRGRSSAARGRVRAHRDRSLLVMERPARRLGAPLAALLVIVVVGGAAAYLIVRAHHVTHPPKQSASAHSLRHTPAKKRQKSGPQTTTTTGPPRYTAVSSTGSSSVYAPVTSTYSLRIGATNADCWMSVTSATGVTVLAQTFAPGASASLSLTGHSSILLGAPRAAKVSIDGVPVVLPSGIAGPYTITLSPA
jgi:hypothetical protein